MKSLTTRPEHRWLLLWGLLLLAALAVAATQLWNKHRWAVDQLADIEPRYARLAGLRESDARIEELDRELADNLGRFVYTTEGDPAQVGNAALQRVRELAATAQLRVTSSQVLAPRETAGFHRVGLNLVVEGDWEPMLQFLQALARQRPMIYSERMQLSRRGSPAPEAPQVIAGNFSLFVLKVRP